MNHFPWMAEFDPLRHGAWVWLGAFALFYAVSILVAVIDQGKTIRQSTLQFVLAHLIFVPAAAFYTVWYYQHPEWFDNNPDVVYCDMRKLWPYLAVLDAATIIEFIRMKWWNWGARALRLMKRAHRLLAKGRIAEADAAYAKARWILDHKCKRDRAAR